MEKRRLPARRQQALPDGDSWGSASGVPQGIAGVVPCLPVFLLSGVFSPNRLPSDAVAAWETMARWRHGFQCHYRGTAPDVLQDAAESMEAALPFS